ncbi:MAG: protein kinase domain-containing protein, partial [Tepidisphaeraceae bacterium]
MDPTPDTPSAPTAVPYHSAQVENVAAAVREMAHPTNIGPYHILELIGEGGMGLVYKAQQREPIHRTVALKIIKLGMDTRQVIARFESERQALALMNHPNVARVLDAGATDRGRPYFVMEFVQGEAITTFADRQKLTVRQRLELFIQACDAVQHAHQKAIIHRDLKPTNILVTLQEGRPTIKVIDFGVAKAVSHRLTEKTLFTESGQLLGTPEYMAPEQAESGTGDVDTRSDVYSLGVVLYELLSGSLPFEPKSLRSAGYAEIQRIIREVDPPRLSTRLSGMGKDAREVARLRHTHIEVLEKQLKGELEWIPLKAMRKDQTQRYSTPNELADDIRNYLENLPLRAGPESATYRLRKFVRRNRRSVMAASGIAIALLVGIVVATALAIRLRSEQVRTLAALSEVEKQRNQVQAANAVTSEVNQLLREMLSAARPEVAAGREITVRELVDQAARTLPARLSSQPLVLAGVQHTLGNTNLSLGRLAQAIEFLRQAVAARTTALGRDHPETIEAGLDLAEALRHNSKADEAEALAAPLLEQSRSIFGVDNRLTLKAQAVLSELMLTRGDWERAEDLSRRAFESAKRSRGDADDLTIRAAAELGNVLSDRGKLREAEPLFQLALEQSRRINGDDHPETIGHYSNLAALYDRLGRSAEAVVLRQRIVEVDKKFLGPQHPT